MLPKGVLVFVVVCANLVFSEARCNCPEQKNHYDELGCKPIYAKKRDCCPSHYNCDNVLNKEQKPGHCYMRNKEYKPQEKADFIFSSCTEGCFCADNRFICAMAGCQPLQQGPDCFYKFNSLNGCCPLASTCPPFDDVFKCKVGDKVYYEGQRFKPENTCKRCLCQKGFKEGKFVEPFCKDINCNMFSNNLRELQNMCAPVYFQRDGCCPYEWECNKIDPTVNTSADKTKSCVFGGKIVKLGEKFELKPKVNCECKIPPLLTCLDGPN